MGKCLSSGGNEQIVNEQTTDANTSKEKTEQKQLLNGADVHKRYQFRRTLGKGASCRVVEAIDRQNKQNKLAIKIMSKEKAICTTLYQHEVDILGRIEHGNIVKFIGGTEDDANYYVLTGLCEGGELFGMFRAYICDFANLCNIMTIYRSDS